MDDVLAKLLEMTSAHPHCMSSRQSLKPLLADYLQTNKREINLLLAAFDEGIVQRFSTTQDVTLAALQFVKLLQTDCGMSSDAAFWTVETWCHLLNQSATAQVIADVNLMQSSGGTAQVGSQSTNSLPVVDIGCGIYKAGVDFTSGELSLQVIGKSENRIWYGLAKNPNRVQALNFFMDKTYLTIEDGQYLKLETSENGVKIRVTKIS